MPSPFSYGEQRLASLCVIFLRLVYFTLVLAVGTLFFEFVHDGFSALWLFEVIVWVAFVIGVVFEAISFRRKLRQLD